MKAFNICIIRPNGYIWSSVFLELADLLCYSITDLGYPAIISENQIHPDSQNIIIGIHLLEKSTSAKLPPDTIVINTEQAGEGPGIWNENIKHFVKQFPSWDYSTENIQWFQQQGIREPLHLKIGFHPRLKRIPFNLEQDIDILFYGSVNKERGIILNHLESSGLRVVRLFGKFGSERDKFIARSKIVLNLHAHASKIFEIVRVHYLMNNAKAVISQNDYNSKIPEHYLDGIFSTPYESIVSSCLQIIASPKKIKELEQNSLNAIMRIDAVEVMAKLLSITPKS